MRNMLPIIMLVLVGCGRPAPKVAPRVKRVAPVAQVKAKVDPRTQPHIMKHFTQLDKGELDHERKYFFVAHCPPDIPATVATVLFMDKDYRRTLSALKAAVRKALAKHLRFKPMLKQLRLIKVKGATSVRYAVVGANGVKLLPKPKPVKVEEDRPMTKEEWERRERGE